MSIIKSTHSSPGAPVIRALSTPKTAPPPDPRLEALRAELSQAQSRAAALATDLADRDAQIGRLSQQVHDAARDARAEGREAGLREAEDNTTRRLERLDQGVQAALSRFAAETHQMEHLALALAAEGLSKIIGDVGAYHDLLARTIRHHVETITAGTLIEVAVSRDDFADSVTLERLASKVSRPDLRLVASPDLNPGECQVRLKLGALDIGVDRQWERLEAILADLGARRAAG